MSEIQRSFITGSEWLYYKIYTGAKTSDLLLTQVIKPLTTELLEKQIIDQWFFIRYGDPDNHLRVRFHCNDPESIGKVISTLYPLLNDYLAKDLIWNIQNDTYKRELERYGSGSIIEAEKYFFHDSQLVMNFLDLIEGVEGEELRWLFGIKAIDCLLDDFKFDLNRKATLMDRLKKGFSYEFRVDKSTKLQLDKKFRTERSKIDWILGLNESNAGEYMALLDILDQKSEAVAPLINNISASVPDEQLNDLLGSYIHMLMNRLFRAKNRLHELVIYYLMDKNYKATIGKIKHANNQSVQSR